MNTNDADFPAAHSMDTDWFAVDRDGHVALFSSGEAGAMPEIAVSEEQSAIAQTLAKGGPRTEALHDLDGRLRADGSAPHQAGLENPLFAKNLVVFLDSLDAVRDELSRGLCKEVRAARGSAVRFDAISRETAERLHAGGLCRGCFTDWHVENAPAGGEGAPPNAAALGLFEYQHADECENWIAGAYGRHARPATPVKLADLPPAVRSKIEAGAVFTDISFAEAARIQPVEHLKSVAWGAGYMSKDGKTIRPIPGMEDQYAEEFEQYAEIEAASPAPGAGGPVTVEPPPPDARKGGPRRIGGSAVGGGGGLASGLNWKLLAAILAGVFGIRLVLKILGVIP